MNNTSDRTNKKPQVSDIFMGWYREEFFYLVAGFIINPLDSRNPKIQNVSIEYEIQEKTMVDLMAKAQWLRMKVRIEIP